MTLTLTSCAVAQGSTEREQYASVAPPSNFLAQRSQLASRRDLGAISA